MPHIDKNEADKKADKKALKKAVKKYVPQLHEILQDFWWEQGYLSMEDYQKLTSYVHILNNRLSEIDADKKYISDKEFLESEEK